MKLVNLLEGLDIIEIINPRDVEISSVTHNSKSCKRGSLFVAIKGSRFNGEDYIPDAYNRGARVFVTENANLKFSNGVLVIVKNARKTLAELCSKITGNPEKRMLFVGITGTKGKTSTSFLLSHMLDFLGEKNLLVGTLGVKGVSSFDYKNTTPDPTVLFPLFREALNKGIRTVILEVSSQALKDYRVHGIPFDSVAFTGLSRDHIGLFEHPSFSDYVSSKRALFTSFGAKRAVVNFDDGHSSYFSSCIPRVIKCGFSEGSDYKISDYKSTSDGAEFSLSDIKIKTSLSGEYNARNIAMSMALLNEISGCRINEIKDAVKYVTIPGRFEHTSYKGRNIVIDYAHNYESFEAVMNLSKKLYGGRIISVFGSVGGRSYERRKEIACAAERYSDFSIITSDNPGYESASSICDEIYGYFNSADKAKIIVDRSEAIRYAIENSNIGDTVLILGKGRESTMKINGQDIKYSDFDVIHNIGSI